jgi:hypothetical protein
LSGAALQIGPFVRLLTGLWLLLTPIHTVPC